MEILQLNQMGTDKKFMFSHNSDFDWYSDVNTLKLNLYLDNFKHKLYLLHDHNDNKYKYLIIDFSVRSPVGKVKQIFQRIESLKLYFNELDPIGIILE
jgi:hypothetical protein